MMTSFRTVRPDSPITEAIRLLNVASAERNRRVFGLMVTNEEDRLVGIISMYDILILVRPKHVRVWGAMDDIDVSGLLEAACERVRTIRVRDIMTTDLITVTPDTSLMAVLDLMIKKHVRRIPVVQGEEIQGIVYLSDLFRHVGGILTQECTPGSWT
jgi:CBS domain-containing protein